MDVTERLVDALSPVLEASGLELIDVVIGGSQVLVTIDRPGGVDLDALAEANRANFSIKSAPNAGTLIEIAFPPSRVVAD